MKNISRFKNKVQIRVQDDARYFYVCVALEKNSNFLTVSQVNDARGPLVIVSCYSIIIDLVL